MKVLIVEDEPFIALDIKALVTAHRHEVVGVAENLSQALNLARTANCDCALVDVKLKDGFTGIQVARALRYEFGIPFAFVTGNPEQLPPGQCGAVGVLEKPFNEMQIGSLLMALSQAAR